MTTSTAPTFPSTLSLAGRSALVTGGSSGIGRAITRKLAADGAFVVFTYNAQDQAADTLITEISDHGSRAAAVQLDLADPDMFAAAFIAVERACSGAGIDGLDILVANAGVFTSGSIEHSTVEEWDRVMGINGRGTLLTLQHAAPLLRDGGRILTISTIGTAWPSPGEAIYAASKAAVEQLTRVASRELGSRGITANTVSLGPTDTDLLRSSAPPEALGGAAAMTALGRLGRPTDIADLIALLAHPDNRWITGQNIRADGGLA